MIELSRSLRVNDGEAPVLGVDDVWAGLVDKAANPLPYVASITECTVTDTFDGGLIRDIIHVGQPVREVVTFTPSSACISCARTARPEVDVPVVSVWHTDASGLIDDYRVFFDLAPVFA